jgi:succinyl-CoA synthetase alpha subunit
MYKQGIENFKYYVGIRSLEEIATRDDRVCVLNILGSESRDVTPIGHAFSGGNVVFGTSPGRGGQIVPTSIGDIPVYNNVLEGVSAGHRFNCGVVYLPPSAARDGVAELIRLNPEVRKIFIVTEKISVRESREIRALGQANGVDIFGGNSLGVADAWQRVRIGGALGGDDPADALRRGSIAILSNSGGFTTTIASYLRLAGWGTTTLISSGKDVYINYAAPEFAFALTNDVRSQAAVLYVEPGGVYEREAEFTKPVIACVVGRWKARLTRAVGHAGAMSGACDDAEAKERWFMERLGVDRIFTPEHPVISKAGAVVTNIAHISAALTAVMERNDVLPDFAPEGDTSLKPWFASNAGLTLPAALDLPVVKALPPYDAQIAAMAMERGAALPRQPMKDASGASRMEPSTQVTTLHGVSVLEAARRSLEANVYLALLHATPDENDCALIDVAIGAEMNLWGNPALAVADAVRAAGNAPNVVLAAAACTVGPGVTEGAIAALRRMLSRFGDAKLVDATDQSFGVGSLVNWSEDHSLFVSEARDAKAEQMLAALRARGVKSVFLRYLQEFGSYPTADAVLAAMAATLAWAPLGKKRVSQLTAERLPWWLRLFGIVFGATAPQKCHREERFCGLTTKDMLSRRSLTDMVALALLEREPSKSDALALRTLVGILLSNGPGTISAQGAKGAVSADGPETPERVQLNKALVGFFTHCGYAHGGNGFEGAAFLVDQFMPLGLSDPGDRNHGLDLRALARAYGDRYARYKQDQKAAGRTEMDKIPGVNHPVFKDRAVNIDPREVFVCRQLEQRGEYNVFLDYYHTLVEVLHEQGVSRTVYCVNIDAAIAAVLLKMLWQPYCEGRLAAGGLENAAFTIFLIGRMLGCAAEIDDHLNRGRNMDTRTPAAECRFIA